MVDWREDSGRLEGGQWWIGGRTVVDWREDSGRLEGGQW